MQTVICCFFGLRCSLSCVIKCFPAVSWKTSSFLLCIAVHKHSICIFIIFMVAFCVLLFLFRVLIQCFTAFSCCFALFEHAAPLCLDVNRQKQRCGRLLNLNTEDIEQACCCSSATTRRMSHSVSVFQQYVLQICVSV